MTGSKSARHRSARVRHSDRIRARLRACVEPLETRRLLTALTIAQENQLPGTPESQWDVSGAGDPTLQGFATDISVNVGDAVSFKINDTQSAPYHIDIYRMGYYQGNGARLVDSIDSSHTQAQVQPAPLTDPATKLIDCGNWSVSASWQVPADATSGIYFARLTRDDTGGASHVMFIVRNDASHSDVLFQTSDTTWEAYNTYGGNSLYGPNGDAANRAFAVSYNRPLTDRGTAGGLGDNNTVFYAEYPMVRWLEANGYDVSYFTDVDSDRYGSLIQNHKIFMSVGHDEYVSGPQRANIEAARDAGVNLAFFSGNETFWKTRWQTSIDGTGTTYRTLVCYKESLDGAATDPSGTWTGTWRDPRFSPPADGGRPENSLSGTIFTVDRGPNETGTPLTVPASDADLRFWRNTSVASLQPGQVATLGDRVLGYEWDEDLDNGSRPAGLFDLSSTTQSVTEKILDYGNRVAPGTATHSLTLYRAPSGALVFGAGTVQWSWGLDGNHDPLGSVPDPAIQQATVNLLADMGVQPATLQANLVPATASNDALAPNSTINPISGSLESGVPMTITGTAVDQGGGVVAGVEVSTDGGATWHPASGHETWSYTWTPGATGPVLIRSRAVDDSGNLEQPAAGVAATVAPAVGVLSIFPASATPTVADAADPLAVEVGVKFRTDAAGYITGIRFYKGPTNTGTHIGNLWSSTGTLLASAVFTGESASGWQTVTFSAPVAITPGTVYVASYHTDVGNYAFTNGYFAVNKADNGPLHALVDSATASNGVFTYGSVPTFPTQTFDSTNYWVDVQYVSGAGTTAPVVSAVSGAATGAQSASVTWTTDKPSTSRVDYGTSPQSLSQSVSLSTFTSAHSVNLTGLSPSTTYYFRVTSVDFFGNTTTSPTAPATFTTPAGSFTDTTTADFGAGAVGTGLYVAQAGDGEITLAPTVATEFSGTALPSDWISTPWTSGGGVTVAGGSAAVDGTLIGTSALYSPGHSLDFVATFGGAPNQHVGIGTNLTAPPWAIFSTGSTGGVLYARTAGATAIDTLIPGNWIGSPHHFRIDWTATGATYWIDGTQVASHAIALGPSGRPIASDFNLDGNSVNVDWMHMSPDAASGTFVSRVFDAGSDVDWSSLLWDASVPANTAANLSVRTGNTPVPDSSWTALTPVTPGGSINSVARYLQYQLDLSTSDPNQAPVVQDVTAFFNTDQTPPTIVGRSPAPGATGVPLTAAVTVSFSEALDPASVSVSSIRLRALGTSTDAPATVTYDPASQTATLQPASALSGSTTYQVTVAGTLTDLVGNPLGADSTWSFSTVDTTPPAILTRTPAPGATAVATSAVVSVQFSEAINPATLTASTLSLRASGAASNIAASISYDPSTATATLTASPPLSGSTTYQVTVSGGITDLAGNPLAGGTTSWTFTTVDTTPPTVVARSPVPGATGVAPSAVVRVQFSEQISLATLTATNFRLRASGASSDVPASISYDASTSTATLTPTSPLAGSTTYQVTVGGGITDLAGNPLAGGTATWTFSTLDNVPPTVIAQNPASGAIGVPATTSVTVTFSEAVDPTTVNGTSFQLRDPANNLIAATVTYNAATNTATLQPTATLTSSTTYTVTVKGGSTGVKDLAGNPLAANVVWSFTTPIPWVQTTAADFGAGTNSGTIQTNSGGGEVQLASPVSDDFAGTTLSSSVWTTSSWTSSGGGPTSVTVSGGVLTLLGAVITSNQAFTNVPVEGRVQFGAAANQAFGMTNATGTSYAIFTTESTTNTLYGQVTSNGTTKDVKIGAIPTGFHVYRVTPISTGFQFYIDGALKGTVSRTLVAGTLVKATLSAFYGSPKPALLADYVRVLSYPSTGTFTSGVFDATRVATWGTVSWTASVPAGTTMVIQVSSGNTATPDASWSAWSTVTNGGAIKAPAARYLRYRVTFTTSNPTLTPVLSDITFKWT